MGVLSLRGWSPQIHTGFHVAGATREYIESLAPFAYGAITLFRRSFQTCSARLEFCNSLEWLQPFLMHPTTPHTQRLQAYTYTV